MKAFNNDLRPSPIQKAIASQLSVKNFLEARGFQVLNLRHPNANGIDLTAVKDGEQFTFEIKSLIYDGTSWRVNRCSNKQAKFIAVVMPSGGVHLELLSDHLRLCAVDGSRRFTGLIDLYIALEREEAA